MSTPTVLPFPRFVAGFPLRASDLTSLFSYLESEDHDTRTCLLGMGIFYGLELSLSAGGGVGISAGAGVTSQGYLYCQDEDLLFNNYHPVQVAVSKFTNTKTTANSTETIEVTTNDQLLDIFELDNAGTNSLDAEFLANKYLVILFEIESNRLNGCSTCSNGFVSNLRIRRLLIPADKWPLLVPGEECAIKPGPAASTGGFPYLNRFGFAGACASDFAVENMAEFRDQYHGSIKTGLEDLIKYLENDLPAFAKALGIKDFVLDHLLDFLKEILVVKFSPYESQYLHDYLRHIIRAYTELVEIPFGRAFQIGLPAEKCFPKYITLGLADQGNGGQIPQMRHPLYRPPLADLDNRDFELATAAFNRLVALLTVTNLYFPELSKARRDIRITPSRTADQLLGNRAIPFYFNGDKMRPSWDFVRSKTRRTDSIAAYDRSSVNAPFDAPLLYQNAFDQANFYRIEGHVEKGLAEVVAELGWPANIPLALKQFLARQFSPKISQRACLNLPFQLVMVSLSRSKIDGLPSLEEFAFQNPGLEHQGGVPSGGTFVLVVEEEVSVGPTPGEHTGNENPNTQKSAVPAAQVAVIRDSQFKVAADFCLPYFYYEVKPALPLEPIAIFKEIPGRTHPPHAEEEPESDAILIAFENQSNFAQSYQWEVFVQGEGEKGEDVLIPSSGPVDKTNFTHIFGFVDQNQFERTFLVRLKAMAEDTAVFDVTQREVIITRPFLFDEPAAPDEPPVTPQPEQPEVIAAGINIPFVEAPAVVPEEQPAPKSAAPPAKGAGFVSPLVVSRRFEERRMRFSKAIDDAGTANAALRKTAVYTEVQKFVKDFDEQVDQFDQGAVTRSFQELAGFDKKFKTIALQLLKNIKKAGGVPAEVYRLILQNLSFFYADKLAHLLTEDTPDTETALSTLMEVFSKIKSDDPASPLIDWRGAWDAKQITTAQNELVINRLNTLFA